MQSIAEERKRMDSYLSRDISAEMNTASQVEIWTPLADSILGADKLHQPHIRNNIAM